MKRRWFVLCVLLMAMTIPLWSRHEAMGDKQDQGVPDAATAPIDEVFAFGISPDPEAVVLQMVRWGPARMHRVRIYGDGRVLLTQESARFDRQTGFGREDWRREYTIDAVELEEIVRFAISRGLADYTQEQVKAARLACGKTPCCDTGWTKVSVNLEWYERGGVRMFDVSNNFGSSEPEYMSRACQSSSLFAHLVAIEARLSDLWDRGGGS